MKLWLCPVKRKSWNIIKSKELFGVSSIGKSLLEQVESNDLLLIYLLKPVHGIIAIFTVNSKVFFDNTDIWGGGRYPYRVKIKPIKIFKSAIPLGDLSGDSNNEKDFEIMPYFFGIEIMEINIKIDSTQNISNESNSLNELLEILIKKDSRN